MSSTADRALIADCLETYVDTLGSGRHKFNTEQGRRDVKVVHDWNNQRSVHTIVDPQTDAVYKPAGCRKPAKHVRYDLADEASCTALLRRAPGPDSFASGYLCVCLR